MKNKHGRGYLKQMQTCGRTSGGVATEKMASTATQMVLGPLAVIVSKWKKLKLRKQQNWEENKPKIESATTVVSGEEPGTKERNTLFVLEGEPSSPSTIGLRSRIEAPEIDGHGRTQVTVKTTSEKRWGEDVPNLKIPAVADSRKLAAMNILSIPRANFRSHARGIKPSKYFGKCIVGVSTTHSTLLSNMHCPPRFFVHAHHQSRRSEWLHVRERTETETTSERWIRLESNKFKSDCQMNCSE